MKKKLYTTHNNERAHYLALLKKKKTADQAEDYVTVQLQTTLKLCYVAVERG